MTKEQQAYKDALPAIQAFVEGKTIQVSDRQGIPNWSDYTSNFPDFSNIAWQWRVKPAAPTLRPWKPEEVPVGAQVRAKNEPRNNWRWLIIAVSDEGIFVGDVVADNLKAKYVRRDFIFCCDRYEHSLDNGKTWLLCGVVVE